MSAAKPKNAGFDGAVIPAASFAFDKKDANLILAHLIFSFIALFLGALAGLLQGLVRAGYIVLPPMLDYYQLLTAHGVLLALVFTTFFIIGFLYSGVAKTLDGKMLPNARSWAWWGFYLMLIGTIMATITILTNDASVLYTFYAPLQASPWFYIGLALVIIGSWSSAVAIFINYGYWRRKHKGEVSPLFAYMAVATMILWIIATIGVAIEVVFQLIPWSLGWTGRVNVALSRTLFWYFGHPLVYFWLLPAYIYWYVNVPRIIKGKIFSNTLPRLTFILFILYSVPVGFHHQLNEPGISNFWKFLQVVLTMIVVFPSLMTAFAIIATFELAGRSQGAKGRFGWVRKLPWGDVRFLAPVLSMLMFIPAGAGGIVNASYQMNQVVHNTLWVTGHFHLTLATSVVLTFFGISYWLIPVLTRRTLTPGANKLGIVQSVLWIAGMLLLGITMHIVGLMGEPRRSSFSTYNDHPTALTWLPYMYVVGIGGILLFISVILFLFAVIYLLYYAPRTDQPAEYPIGEVEDSSHRPPLILERWSLWIAVTVVLVLVAYTVPVWHLMQTPTSTWAPPVRTW